MKKIIRVILSPEAEEIYNYLKTQSIISKKEQMILNAIHNKIELIKDNTHYGNAIAKKLIPKEYKIKYGISNLFRIELPCFWRMLYTLTNKNTKIEIIAFVLDILNHKDYNKKFGYKNIR